jgi:hypothetical protein
MVQPGHEIGVHGRRGAKQHQQQEGVAAEVADQAEVLVTAHAGEGPVVMDARDGLHARAVAVGQAPAVDGLGLADVGCAVLTQGDLRIGRQGAGHGAHPHQLGADVLVDKAVDIAQLSQGLGHAGVHAGDEFQLRFAEIGGDVRVRQGRAQSARVGRHGIAAARAHPKAFFLDAALHAQQALGAQGA